MQAGNGDGHPPLPSPYSAFLQLLQKRSWPPSLPECQFYAWKWEGRTYFFFEDRRIVLVLHELFGNQMRNGKTSIKVNGRIFDGYDLSFTLDAYVAICKKLGLQHVDFAVEKLGLRLREPDGPRLQDYSYVLQINSAIPGIVWALGMPDDFVEIAGLNGVSLNSYLKS